MRSPRRLSRPTTSERRRPRSEPSDRPESFRGIWTRRPSARIAMATWRRLRPSNRPKAWSPEDARPTRAVRAVYEAFRVRATSGGWRRGAPPPASVGRPRVRSHRLAWPAASLLSQTRGREASNRLSDTTRPSVARRSLSPPICPRVEDRCSLPAQSRLENQGGACQRGQQQENPEGLSLQHASHPISASAGPRRE